MHDSKRALTPEGYDEYRLHLKLMEKAVDFFLDLADDLSIGGTDEDGDLLYEMLGFLDRMANGPWTEDYDADYGPRTGQGQARTSRTEPNSL